MHLLFEPGFFSSPQVQNALVIGSVVAIVSGIVGVFTVIRGQSFAGHAFTDTAATGGSGASLANVNPLIGFVFGAIAAAGVLEMLGVRHERGRDLSTGIVLGASIGLASLFLYLGTSNSSTSGAPQQILFGSIFTTTPSTVPSVIVLGVISLAIIIATYRPLLLSTIDPDIASARGVLVRPVGVAYMLALALAVGLSSIAIGAILSTALLIGPAALSLRVTKRIWHSLFVAAMTGVIATWLGVLFAYDSSDWMSGNGLPVSFLIVGIIFCAYVLTVVGGVLVERRRVTPAPRAT